MLTFRTPIWAMLASLSGKCVTGPMTMTASPYVLLDDSLTGPGAAGGPAVYESRSGSSPPIAGTRLKPGSTRSASGLARGLHAAGFFAYELGYCLEPKLQSLLPQDRSGRCSGSGCSASRAARRCRDACLARRATAPLERATISDLQLSWTREQYDQRLRQGSGLHRRRRRLSDQPHAEISLRLRRATRSRSTPRSGASSGWPMAR